MRRLLLSSLLAAAVACPSIAFAQEAPSRSVDDYLCTFAGKCGDEAEEEPTTDAPETKGFSLARPGAAAEPTKEAPKTKGFSLSRPAAPASKEAPKTKGFSLSRPANAQAAAKPAAPAKKVAAPAQKSAAATAKKASATKPVRSASASTKNRPAASKAGMVEEKRADLRLAFELGSDTLTPQAMEEAKIFAQSLMAPEMEKLRFVIEGHTDAQGSREFNLDLSQRRAQAVADYLASLGVSRERLEVRGYGFDRPLPGRSAASQDNRRVEAVLTS